MGRPLGREVRRLRRSMLVRQRLPRRTHRLNNRLPQKYQLWMPQACDDAARKVAAATDDKPARSWAKHTKRRTCTSYRLTLELSGARLFARPLGRVRSEERRVGKECR